ncbi:COR domain-containing protein [Hymenobacter defluvii]|uniref:non-specific serine/threonine protein kinase n=1 Tax=Hymenobacter defluvii TaxID=2054411 RepID=A0ABS3T8M6_9BACT|nr:COR domain-containing protein [Hymenobacter defluvii]MBO3269987.1 GTP-binding protein [Hymenobacter defluvii]
MTRKELVDHIQIAKDNSVKSLDLSGKGLLEIPAEIGMLTEVTYLDLSNNSLTYLPKEIGYLEKLSELNIKDNELKSLPEEFGCLFSLELIHMNGNNFDEFPNCVYNMKKLKHICIAGNNISEISDEIENLIRLNDIQLYQNNFTSFPLSLTKLYNIKSIGLGRNKIKEIPIEVTNMNSLTELKLDYNPLRIPPEVLSKNTRYLFNHIRKHEESKNKKYFSEAKLVFVGDGNVGKTSLIRVLQGQRFDRSQSKTDGISIKKWNVKVDEGRDVSVNIWDFGGQEIMHATHQFFLTERSVYVLVLNTREEDRYGMVEYWLKLIRSFGGDSPIIVALNKCDEHMGDVDRKGLKAKYNIHGFVMTSCKDNTGKKELLEFIKESIGSLEHTKFEWIDKEFNVKRRLEDMKYDYISYDEYKAICKQQGVEDDKDLIGFLHDLGIVLNFKNDERLSDTNILNPSWVTDGVYKIINSKLLFESKGVLEINKVSSILNGKTHPKNKHLFIIDMMKHFELCFDIEGTKGEKLLIPELLPIQEPDFDWNYRDNLSFQYKYDFLTSSIISRFIVKIHYFVYDNIYWKNGVVIKLGENRCLIKADREEKIVYIFIDGEKITRRDALSKVRIQFDLIHNSINSIAPVELIPINGTKETVKYRHMLQYEKADILEYITENGNHIKVSELLDGIDTSADKVKMFSEGENLNNISNSFSPVINISNNDVSEINKNRHENKVPWYKKTWLFIIGLLGFIGLIIAIVNDGFSVFDRFNKSKNSIKPRAAQDTILVRSNKHVK